MEARWLSAVRFDNPSCVPMSRLERPLTAITATSCSRAAKGWLRRSSAGVCTPAHRRETGVVETSVVPNPVVADLDVRPTTLRTGQRGTARVWVENLATSSLSALRVRLVVPDGIEIIGSTVHEVADLRGGQRRAVRWRLCAYEPGNHIVFAQVEAVDPSSQLSFGARSTGRVISVVHGGPPGDTCLRSVPPRSSSKSPPAPTSAPKQHDPGQPPSTKPWADPRG